MRRAIATRFWIAGAVTGSAVGMMLAGSPPAWVVAGLAAGGVIVTIVSAHLAATMRRHREGA